MADVFRDFLGRFSRLPEWLARTAFLVAGFVLLEVGLARGGKWLRRRIGVRAAEGRLPALRIQQVTLITPQRTGEMLLGIVKWGIPLLQAAVAVAFMMGFFLIYPSTRGWGAAVWGWILTPLRSTLQGIVDFIPDLLHILVFGLVANLFLRALRRIGREVEAGNIRIAGFYPDWAKPTLNIVTFITYAFVLVLIFPYLPGSSSPVFKGVSVFLGILISLGSSSAFSNIIAGLVITYMRSFRIGDRVQVGDVTGDVIEKTLLVTRVRTVHHETVTLPNAALLAGNTVNFSDAAAGSGLLLHTTVTIGYDVPWRKVHELLQSAAARTPGVLRDPSPFVLQNGLQDFYVAYELNAAVREAHRMRFIYSELHQNIQDAFFESGVEIMSPHYFARRDGSKPAIPEPYRRPPGIS
jgi:small-conductance mechanosensitive channel